MPWLKSHWSWPLPASAASSDLPTPIPTYTYAEMFKTISPSFLSPRHPLSHLSNRPFPLSLLFLSTCSFHYGNIPYLSLSPTSLHSPDFFDFQLRSLFLWESIPKLPRESPRAFPFGLWVSLCALPSPPLFKHFPVWFTVNLPKCPSPRPQMYEGEAEHGPCSPG